MHSSNSPLAATEYWCRPHVTCVADRWILRNKPVEAWETSGPQEPAMKIDVPPLWVNSWFTFEPARAMSKSVRFAGDAHC
jgi:hypothetical protein